MLSAASPYFKAMFMSNFKESTQIEIELHGTLGAELKSLVDFSYTGIIKVNETNVIGILHMATRMEFVQIELKCRNFLLENLNTSTCLAIWTSLQPFLNFNELCTAAFKYAETNFMEIIETEDFLALDVSDLFALLGSDGLDVWSEEEVFKGLIKWVNFDYATRKSDFAKLLSAIRLTYIKTKVQILFHPLSGKGNRVVSLKFPKNSYLLVFVRCGLEILRNHRLH